MVIEYRFQFSEDHLLTAFLRHQQQIAWLRPLLRLRWPIVLLFGGMVLSFAWKGLAVAAAGYAVILALLLFGGSANAWLLRRQFRKSPFHDDSITLTLSATGSHATGRDSEVRTDWAAFTKARRFPDGLLLFQGPRVFIWLPDTAATNGTSAAAAQALARNHIPDYRDI